MVYFFSGKHYMSEFSLPSYEGISSGKLLLTEVCRQKVPLLAAGIPVAYMPVWFCYTVTAYNLVRDVYS